MGGACAPGSRLRRSSSILFDYFTALRSISGIALASSGNGEFKSDNDLRTRDVSSSGTYSTVGSDLRSSCSARFHSPRMRKNPVTFSIISRASSLVRVRSVRVWKSSIVLSRKASSTTRRRVNGGKPDPKPWGAFSYAPLIEVARTYAAAGAEVYNLDLEGTAEPVA